MNNIWQTASELKQQDASYLEIADRFNSEGIPTFSGSGKWDKKPLTAFTGCSKNFRVRISVFSSRLKLRGVSLKKQRQG
jgi:hypothetical protein